MSAAPTVREIFLVALRLGLTSFGGPVAHLGFFHREYVERRRWVDAAEYADLVALCQFLPGPASSQVGFGVGLRQRGVIGGLAAWLGFTLPSAIVMIAFGVSVATLDSTSSRGWLHGLKVAAVAVVAQAVVVMWRSLCPDVARSIVALAAATAMLALPFAWTQIALIVAGALLGSGLQVRVAGAPSRPRGEAPTRDRGSSWIWLAVFAAGLVLLPAAVRFAPNDWLVLADKFYRAGALVFGGGHVVLPLLEREMVGSGLVTRDAFLAGYGVAQAVPGPLFSFAGHLGAASTTGARGWAGGAWAIVWIFVPSLVLVLAAWPWWQKLRRLPRAQSALAGTNAVVVGLLLAALVTPVGSVALVDAWSAAGAAAAFAALQFPRVRSWLVVLACAVVFGFFLQGS